MKLYLLQHGEAWTKDVDPERPLSEVGQSDIDRLGNFLQRAGITVERVIHSGKLRAQQTAERLAVIMASGLELESSGLINPNDSPRAFDWQSESWDRDTMIVGHLPFMTRLVSHLLVGDENRLITAYVPGTMVCLEHGEDSQWRINWMMRPELLK